MTTAFELHDATLTNYMVMLRYEQATAKPFKLFKI